VDSGRASTHSRHSSSWYSHRHCHLFERNNLGSILYLPRYMHTDDAQVRTMSSSIIVRQRALDSYVAARDRLPSRRFALLCAVFTVVGAAHAHSSPKYHLDHGLGPTTRLPIIIQEERVSIARQPSRHHTGDAAEVSSYVAGVDDYHLGPVSSCLVPRQKFLVSARAGRKLVVHSLNIHPFLVQCLRFA
jgi:hypothetical protein